MGGVQRACNHGSGLRRPTSASVTGQIMAFAREADVGNGRLIVPVRNVYRLSNWGNLAALLCRVIFVGESSLGAGAREATLPGGAGTSAVAPGEPQRLPCGRRLADDPAQKEIRAP